MATLTAPHWEAVTPEARDALAVLGQLPLLRPFYLAGGTALALRLGHRISRDPDRVQTLLEDYAQQFVTDFLAAKPPLDKPAD